MTSSCVFFTLTTICEVDEITALSLNDSEMLTSNSEAWNKVLMQLKCMLGFDKLFLPRKIVEFK